MATPKQRSHSGEGHLVSNIITFALMMVLFLGSLVAFGLEPEIGAIPAFGIGLALFTLSFFIPKQIIGRSDSHKDLAS
ncbi:hypothetical protein D477_013521 [Arthrobacter crystallopoietes BAB-32]|uniref:Uncharacterized protein n=1 Tax=Arthrobacter crystallopoietes BAB-32 TaxID=1246476 RepID=N1V615_9MICC|nr:hypothetical protein [Arthrobacter crystallopoietes]EMY33688.1 hypothetical protein D477_013521 [Arthrobacter crystallopoietes BAB-32]